MKTISAIPFLLAIAVSGTAAVAPVTKTVQVTSPEIVIASGAGHQEDPHIGGTVVAYTDLNTSNPSSVGYYDLATGAGGVIPQNAPDFDFAPDVHEGRITFTRVDSTGSFVYLFDMLTQTVREVDPGLLNRVSSAIGSGTLAWTENLGPIPTASVIAMHDEATSTTTHFAHGPEPWNLYPSVSADGNVVVWVNHDDLGMNAVVIEAVRTASGWSVTALTGAVEAEFSAHTDGALVVYDSRRSGDMDIYWQPVGGGAETQLAVAGWQQTINVFDGLIVFDTFLNNTVSIYAYDTITATLFQVTSAGTIDFWPDVHISGDIATVVFTRFNGLDNDVVARSFPLNRQASAGLQLDSLRAAVAVSGNQLTKALDAKLRAADSALANGDTTAACAALQDFINHVAAQRGKKIAVVDADSWTTAAQALRSTLGCV